MRRSMGWFRFRLAWLLFTAPLLTALLALSYISYNKVTVIDEFRRHGFIVQYEDELIKADQTFEDWKARQGIRRSVRRDVALYPVSITEWGGGGVIDSNEVERRLQCLKKLPHFSRVRIVGLRQAPLTEDVLKALRRLPLLESLGIGEATSEPMIAQSLSTLRHLRELDLSNSRIVDDIAAALSNQQSLERIDLSFTAVGKETCSQLAKLPKLTDVTLAYCEALDAEALTRLYASQSIELLDLGSNDFADEDVLPLGKMVALRELQLNGNFRITKHGVDALKALKPNLDVSWDDGPRAVGAGLAIPDEKP